MTSKGYLRLDDFRGKLKPYERSVKKTPQPQPTKVSSASTGTGYGGVYVTILHVLVVALAALVVQLGWDDAQKFLM